MSESVEDLEQRISQLRAAIRKAALRGDAAQAKALRRDLRATERAWDDALEAAEEAATPEPATPATAATATATAATAATADAVPRAAAETAANTSLLPLREQVYEALSVLTVPAAPRLISTVHEAFFASTFPSSKLTSLKRDEERSFKSAPYARPYYICAALTADLLAPSRGLLAVSTWKIEKRVIGSLSPRVDFLTAAIQVATAVERIPAPVPAARRLLWRFAASIPGAGEARGQVRPAQVIEAAEAELSVHIEADTGTRKEAAKRARKQLTDAEQLFGARLHAATTRERRG
jgi:hypothetical protein